MKKEKEKSVVVRAAKYEQVVNDLKSQKVINETLVEALNQSFAIMQLGEELLEVVKVKYNNEIEKRDNEIARLSAVVKTLIGK